MYLTGRVTYTLSWLSWYDYSSYVYMTYGQVGGAGAFRFQHLVQESGPIYVGQSYWMTPGGWNGQALTGSATSYVWSSSEQVTGSLGVKSAPANPANVGVGTYANTEYPAWDQTQVYFH